MEVKRVVSPAGKNFEIALKNLQSTKVGKVGWFQNSKYENGLPVALIAAQNEFGNPSKHIPGRPFLRPTIVEKEREWADIATAGARAILRGNQTVGSVLEGLGLKAAGDVRKKISLITQPPLSPVTIYNRLHRKSNKKTIGLLTKPLIDTGIMIGTLTNSVEDE